DVYALDVRNGGVYGTFPLTGPYNISSTATIPNDIYASDFDVTGTLYALETTNANLLSIDPDTGAITVVAPLTGAATGVTYSGLSWNKTDRKSTRLNSSHVKISYAVLCLKKKKYNLTSTRIIEYHRFYTTPFQTDDRTSLPLRIHKLSLYKIRFSVYKIPISCAIQGSSNH